MCFMLFIMKFLEYGSLSLFYFYGKFQFDWDAKEYVASERDRENY